MEDIITESNGTEEQSSFGIKKIVDCKIGAGGQQMYKVKWQPTWEPAENLASCQHLVDKFWLFVNKAKANEELAQQHRKRMRLDQSTNNVTNIDPNFDRMSNDDKAEVQRLISRTNATSAGNQMLMSPSNMLMTSPQRNQQNNVMGMVRTPTQGHNQNMTNSPQVPQNTRQQNPAMPMVNTGQASSNFESPQHQSFGASGDCEQSIDSPGKKGKMDSNASSLKYLENFSNPYVKVLIVCKICNKEASKNSGKWKIHFLTHASNEDKPHKCHICNQGFVQNIHLKRHMKKHEKTQGFVSEGSAGIRYDNQSNFKTELFY